MSSSPETPKATVLTGLSAPMRTARLTRRNPHSFEFRPDLAARRALAEDLGISAIKKLSFSGKLVPSGNNDWRLVAQLGATVVQPCVVSGVPVTTRIDEDVSRHFLAQMPELPPGEIESPDDDSIEPLGAVLDPGEMMREALALALPDYPRSPEASQGEGFEASFGADDEDEAEEVQRPSPFAALAQLKAKNGDEQA